MRTCGQPLSKRGICQAEVKYEVETATGVQTTCALHLGATVQANITHRGTAVVTAVPA